MFKEIRRVLGILREYGRCYVSRENYAEIRYGLWLVENTATEIEDFDNEHVVLSLA